ncbi:MAG: hypothetical protein ABIR26_10425 [Ramlibacter sp.]
MNQSIEPGLVPPRPGLEREEPELAQEDDIPKDDSPAASEDDESTDAIEKRPLRHVERE